MWVRDIEQIVYPAVGSVSSVELQVGTSFRIHNSSSVTFNDFHPSVNVLFDSDAIQLKWLGRTGSLW
jgi:hypothetical protein